MTDKSTHRGTGRKTDTVALTKTHSQTHRLDTWTGESYIRTDALGPRPTAQVTLRAVL